MLMFKVHKHGIFLNFFGLKQELLGPRARFKEISIIYAISLRNSNFLKSSHYSVFLCKMGKKIFLGMVYFSPSRVPDRFA